MKIMKAFNKHYDYADFSTLDDLFGDTLKENTIKENKDMLINKLLEILDTDPSVLEQENAWQNILRDIKIKMITG